jgi:hypothetical protein
MRTAVKSLLLVVVAGLVLAFGAAAPASAKTPCAQAVINDWFDDGIFEHTYAPSCYTQAIKQLPRDAHIYSSAPDDIRRAMLAALSKGKGSLPPTSGQSNPSKGIESAPPPKQETHSKGLVLKAIEFFGPSNAASIPLPLLILAGVAFLLLAAAGGSVVNRRLQERRLPPPHS